MNAAALFRARAIEAARNVLLERGVQAFSLRALARHLGVTAPALYRTFDGKDALMIEVVERSYDLLHDRLFRALQGSDARERLALTAQGYLDFALAYPRDYAVMSLLPGAFGLDALPESLHRRDATVLRLWTDRVRETMDAGVIRPGPPEETAALFLATARGLLGLHLHGTATGWLDHETLTRLYWRSGIALMEGVAGPAWSRDDLPAPVRDGLGTP